MDTDKYRMICLGVLSNREWYAQIPVENIQTFNHDYDVIVSEAYNIGIIDKDVFEALWVVYQRTPSFYLLPKTHKNRKKCLNTR